MDRAPHCVFQVGDIAIAHGVPEKLRGCPFIHLPRTDRAAFNEFLEERWRGTWRPKRDENIVQRALGRKVYKPAAGSVFKCAHWGNHFLRWCEAAEFHGGRRLSWRAATEFDIDRYGEDMASGRWSIDGRAASDSYIAACQLTAIHFLQWAADRKFRDRVELTGEQWEQRSYRRGGNPAGSQSKRTRYLVVRRVDPAEINYPQPEVVDCLINLIPSASYQLGARLIFGAGLRALEVCRLPDADVPTLAQNLATNGVGSGFFRVEGKGRKRRSVEITAELTRWVDEYRELPRQRRLHKFRKVHPARNLPLALLLNDQDGSPISYRSLWLAIRTAGKQLGITMTPHLGRHTYAMHYLLKVWRREQEAARQSGHVLSVGMASNILSTPLVLLQQNLGHADFRTTERYLVAMVQFVSMAEFSNAYNQLIDGERT